MPHRVEPGLGLREDSLSSQGPMAQNQIDPSAGDAAFAVDTQAQAQQQSLWRRIIFGRDKDNGSARSGDASSKGQSSDQQDDLKSGVIRRVSRKVVPGLPRAQTFKRQQSELRNKLEPIQPTPAERRAVSMDRRGHASTSASFSQSNPRTSAPDFLHHTLSATTSIPSLPINHVEEKMTESTEELNGIRPEWEAAHDVPHIADVVSQFDAHSMTTSQYDSMIHDELERIWILNLSMHFRDKSKREKFFVTFREHDTLWRRVTISLDYRSAPDNSLEMELVHTKFQRDKSAKIYEAIRESLGDIQFYNTVTNLKLQTTDGRLHVHVVEDVNEIINYPTVRMILHMRCRRVKEREIEFDSHLSGFVYKVRVNNEMLIKKEIPGPDTVEEFLYEINALNRLRLANNVIQFYGVIVDDKEEHVKGLLISYAEQGALIDVLYDGEHSLPWNTRERWARQIVNGLSEIHEAGFVQGDFTLSNIVVNDEGDAKIIDINRRGCPVGWEPPEATPLIESNQRISMYIGVKSDLYQLGMVLWALATQEDEPEAHGRPLRIGSDVKVPGWYCRIVEICLSEDPRFRIQALHLLSMFPDVEEDSQYGLPNASSISIDEGSSRHEHISEPIPANGIPQIKTVQPPSDWAYVGWGNPQMEEDSYFYPPRGRSPPSPLPSNHGGYRSPRYGQDVVSYSDNRGALTAPSVSDVPHGELGAISKAALSTEELMKTKATESEGQPPGTAEIVGKELETKKGDGQSPLVQENIEPREVKDGDEAPLSRELSTPHEPTEAEDLGDNATAERPDFKGNGQILPLTDSYHGPDAGKTEPDIEIQADRDTEVDETPRTYTHLDPGEGLHVLRVSDTLDRANTPGFLEGGHDPVEFPAGSEAADTPSITLGAPQDITSVPADEKAAAQQPSDRDMATDVGLAPPSPGMTSSQPVTTARVPDALTGIGSAYDDHLDMEKRHALIPEDDFGMILEASPEESHDITTDTTATGIVAPAPAVDDNEKQ
ncbi:protein kinase [Apodospora peruviana]|uniref:Protein kinase n=1 Tax=Apodospora peruviana TaxID=516989 RepID=A0AAE0M450_9PEZI|nr:protein kinase [Apodospora peruviana]